MDCNGKESLTQKKGANKLFSIHPTFFHLLFISTSSMRCCTKFFHCSMSYTTLIIHFVAKQIHCVLGSNRSKLPLFFGCIKCVQD